MLTAFGKSNAKVWQLATQLGIANTHLHIFTKLNEAQLHSHKRELYKSLDFWHYTLNAHIQATIVHLCRLFDSHETTLHLLRFVEDVPDTNLTQKQRRQKGNDLAYLRKVDRRRNKGPAPPVAKLRTWRNKIIAHNDYDLAVNGRDTFVQHNPIILSEIQSLIDFGFELLERWKPHYQCKSDLPRFASGKDDYQFVLQSLQVAIQNSTSVR